MPTKIEWATEVWNPVTGCTPVSAGCANCYAARMAKRLRGRYGYPADEPFRVTLHRDKLEAPTHWRKPRRVFVCSMGDLFHKDVPDDYLYRVFSIMRRAYNKHTFLVLTKRPKRMCEFVTSMAWRTPTRDEDLRGERGWHAYLGAPGSHAIENIHLGVSIENQQTADERLPLLLETPAAVRFVSAEPLLGPVDFARACDHGREAYALWGDASGISQVICGGESGPGARPMHLDWARGVRNQCVEAGVPFFFKQWGEWSPDKERFASSWARDRLTVEGEWDNPSLMFKVGKQLAGRLLDGREWNEFPRGKG